MIKLVLRVPFWALVRSSLCLAGLLWLAGCSSDKSGSAIGSTPGPAGKGILAAAQQAQAMQSADALRIGEEILIEFSGNVDPPPRHQERIKTDGTINLPSIGSVQAAGRTRGELEEAIQKIYVPAYYKQLTVVVRNEGRYFYVAGQVKNPNQFQYLKEMTVLKAITTAGGFTDFAKKTDVLVTRADGRTLRVNCNKALRNPKLDVAIFPDDTIEVPRRYF